MPSGVNVQECGAGGCAQEMPGRAWRSDVGGGRRARRDAAVFSRDLDLFGTAHGINGNPVLLPLLGPFDGKQFRWLLLVTVRRGVATTCELSRSGTLIYY